MSWQIAFGNLRGAPFFYFLNDFLIIDFYFIGFIFNGFLN